MLKNLQLSFFGPVEKSYILCSSYNTPFSVLNTLNGYNRFLFSYIDFFFKYFISIPYSIKTRIPTEVINKKKVFSRYFYNGLGYKVFTRLNHLFIWIGLTHYTIIPVPQHLKVFIKKKRFFIIGFNKIKFNEFLMRIRRIKKIDVYKGKGLLELKSYKGFIKMKVGKKKQY